MIDGLNFFDQPVRNDSTTHDKIRKTTIYQEDDSTTGCLLDYNYFKKPYNMIATDFSKQQVLDADPNTAQQINWKIS